MLEYHKMTEEEKYCIARWKYPGEYAIYNSLSYEEQKKRGFGFANPENHLYSFYDGKDLVGFINLNGGVLRNRGESRLLRQGLRAADDPNGMGNFSDAVSRKTHVSGSQNMESAGDPVL